MHFWRKEFSPYSKLRIPKRETRISFITSYTRGRPVFDVAGDVDDGVVVSIKRRPECVALTDAYGMVGSHGVHLNISHLHTTDKSTPGSHTQSDGGWNSTMVGMSTTHIDGIVITPKPYCDKNQHLSCLMHERKTHSWHYLKLHYRILYKGTSRTVYVILQDKHIFWCTHSPQLNLQEVHILQNLPWVWTQILKSWHVPQHSVENISWVVNYQKFVVYYWGFKQPIAATKQSGAATAIMGDRDECGNIGLLSTYFGGCLSWLYPLKYQQQRNKYLHYNLIYTMAVLADKTMCHSFCVHRHFH